MNVNLETERLLLSPRSVQDFNACLEMDLDTEVTKFVLGIWNGGEEHRAFLHQRLSQDFGRHYGYWKIAEKNAPHKLIGWISFIPYDGIGPDLEIGWRLIRNSWRKGFATEAATAVLKHAFLTANTERLILDTHAQNTASIRVAEKLGFVHIKDEVYEEGTCKTYELDKRAYLDRQVCD